MAPYVTRAAAALLQVQMFACGAHVLCAVQRRTWHTPCKWLHSPAQWDLKRI